MGRLGFGRTWLAAACAVFVMGIGGTARADLDAQDTPPPARHEARGLLGPIRVGPLAGIGASTHPVDLEAFAKIAKLAGVGFEYAFAPKVNLAGIDLRTTAIGVDARLFALSGSFFLGAGAGYQTATAIAEGVGTAKATSYYVTPRLGWLWVADFGLSVGFDVGATIPIKAKVAVQSDVPHEYMQSQIDMANKLSRMPMPDAKLRLGFLF